MIRLFFFALLFTIPSLLTAQSPFENISFESALVKAKAQHKLILLQLESLTCQRCNEVGETAFRSPDLVSKLASDCISVKVAANDSSWGPILKKYNARNTYGTLFVDENGVLVHRYNGTHSLGKVYISQIETAKAKLKEAGIYTAMEKRYEAGYRDIDFLSRFLKHRNNLNLDNENLLEEFVQLLPQDSLTSVNQLRFIASHSPVLGSHPDKILRRDTALFNKAWYTLSLPERIKINNEVIVKSRNRAIEKRDHSSAFRVADFARNTNTDKLSGQTAFERNILEFYKAIKDTMIYLSMATRFFDNVYMKIPVDSIKRIDSLRLRDLGNKTPGDTIRTSDGKYTIKRSVIFNPSVQNYSSALNDAARSFYMFTRDTVHLTKALSWTKRSNEFYQSSASLDTYARILYAFKKQDEARLLQQKAIDIAVKHHADTVELKEVLRKMINGEPL